ncbi:MAG: sulfotransferase domain-containing protein [Xanthomonadales bacterium]|nr:sulfotransferase domain-containing protein [Xanthomonadales bacterium]
MNATEPGRAPDFLIIGAQKCGTSWLHHQLRQSDEIFMPADKDHEHFSYVGNLNAEAFADWCRRFAPARAGQHQIATPGLWTTSRCRPRKGRPGFTTSACGTS